jgi:hypothetical protein
VALTDSQPVIYATLGVLAVVFVVAMWALARRLRPEAVGHFEVLADLLEVGRGEEVEAELTIHYRADVGARIEVGLVCVERYDHPVPTRGEDGEPAVERRIGEEVAFESWLPAWRTEERQTVRFRIPPDAPYSHEGECLSLHGECRPASPTAWPRRAPRGDPDFDSRSAGGTDGARTRRAPVRDRGSRRRPAHARGEARGAVVDGRREGRRARGPCRPQREGRDSVRRAYRPRISRRRRSRSWSASTALSGASSLRSAAVSRRLARRRTSTPSSVIASA